MGNIVFNIAKGKAKYYAELPAANDALVLVLLKSAGLVGDTVMADYDDLAAVLAGASDECDFTNYARKTITSVTNTVDDTNDRFDSDFADQTWTSAGGATNNSIGKLLVCYDPDTTAGTDSSIIPLTAHDFVYTTTGADLPAQVDSAGFYRAA